MSRRGSYATRLDKQPDTQLQYSKPVEPGKKNRGGRPVGSRNKVPTEIRQALLEGGRLAGLDIAIENAIDERLELWDLENPKASPQKRSGFRRKLKNELQGAVHGDLVDYFRHMALKKPTAFMATLSKVIPKQIDVNMQLTSREVLEEIQRGRGQLEAMRDTVIDAVVGVDYHPEEAEI